MLLSTLLVTFVASVVDAHGGWQSVQTQKQTRDANEQAIELDQCQKPGRQVWLAGQNRPHQREVPPGHGRQVEKRSKCLRRRVFQAR